MSKAQDDAELAYILTAIYLNRQQRDIVKPFKKVLSESSNPDHSRLAALLLTDDLHDQTNQMLARNLFKRYPGNIAFRFLYLVFLREFNDFDETDKHSVRSSSASPKAISTCFARTTRSTISTGTATRA